MPVRSVFGLLELCGLVVTLQQLEQRPVRYLLQSLLLVLASDLTHRPAGPRQPALPVGVVLLPCRPLPVSYRCEPATW